MKVYVMTKAVPFGKEEYIGVKKSSKEAIMFLKKEFPFMRESNDTFVSDNKNSYLLFIHEEEI